MKLGMTAGRRLRAVAVATGVASVVSVGLVPTATAQAELQVKIELTEMSPRLVTADSTGVLTVIGRVTNDGDRTIEDLGVRVQRGDPLVSEADLQAALSGDASTDIARPRFTDLPDALGPGSSAPFRVDVPLSGGGPLDSLQIAGPGVYPLLVNLNGRPDFGGRARLAAVRMLLPVIGLPGQVTLPPVLGTGPTPLTIVWPLVDRPQRLPTADTEPVTLVDDSLADSLAPGGRLEGLVRSALDHAPAGSPLGAALCVAIDPDLVDTVRLMAGGYVVADGTPGTGQTAAVEWLRSVRELVVDRCVLALPMADVDLVALSRAGLTDLQGRARTDGAQILRDVLAINPITELAWPADELVDERTLTDLASLGVNGVLVDPGGLTDGGRYAGEAVVGLTTGSPATASARGVLVDTVAELALAGRAPGKPASRPGQPGQQVTVVPSTSPSGTDAPLAGQDGLAALTFQSMTRGPAGVLLTPPRRWSADPVESGELLRTASRLLADGLARPRDLGSLAGGAPPSLSATLSYPVQAGPAELPRSLTARVGDVRDRIRDVEAATRRDPRFNFDPARLLDPIKFGLVRATSTAWRGNQSAANRTTQYADDRLTRLRESVKLVPPPGPYLLAASNSPLLLNLDNPLPVQIDVLVTLSPVAGLRTGPIDVISLPANSRRQVRVPAEVVRAGQFSVEAQLTTPGGTPLGPRGAASRIQLRSTAYGTVTLMITVGGAGALVLLSALRITRRVRAARAQGGTQGD